MRALESERSQAARFDEAVQLWETCVRLNPHHAEAWNNLGTALMEMGRFDDSIAAYRAAVNASPAFAAAHSNLVYAMHFDPRADAAAILEGQLDWNRRHAQPLRTTWRPHDNDRSPDRKLRIGYVSPDLRNHPVGFFIEPVIQAHDLNKVDLVCYDECGRAYTKEVTGYQKVQVAVKKLVKVCY